MRFLIPGRTPLIISVLGVFAMLLGGLLSILIGLDSVGETLYMTAMGLGLFALFPLILALGLAGAIEDKAGAKAALFGAGTAVALPLMLAVTVGMLSDVDAGAAIGGGVCCSAPLFIAMLIPALIYGFQAPAAMREAARRERAQAMAGLLEEQGELNLERHARQRGLSPEQTRDAAELLRDDPRSGVMMDPSGELLFLRAAFDEKRARLGSLLKLQGRLTIAAAARELRISEEKVRELVHALVQAGEFDGYADWEAGVLTSSDAGKIGEAARCESCGGRMGLAGKGLLKCDRCGAEIYL